MWIFDDQNYPFEVTRIEPAQRKGVAYRKNLAISLIWSVPTPCRDFMALLSMAGTRIT